MLIANGPVVMNDDTTRANIWFNEDGSITAVIEGEHALDDRTLEVPVSSVDSDLRVKLGFSKPLPAPRVVPDGVFAKRRHPRAGRAKRSHES